ncbi:MAG: internal scaffolding protein [Microviridae sp.]|nr:MAG: internal scaffolding protein [Microviridae sp.]
MIDQDGVIGVFVRSAYNYDTNTVSRETGLQCLDTSKTQQQFRDECDINVILQRFGVTGHLPITTVQPMEGDFTNVQDYQGALETVRAANENFMRLPSLVREKFGQDPKVFVDFCLNPANIDAVRELGLAPRPAAPTLKEIVNATADGKS